MAKRGDEGRLKEGRELVYDAVLYGLGATLGELAKTEAGARIAEELHKTFGRYLTEYLRLRGITYETGVEPEKLVQRVIDVFNNKLGFAKLEEVEPTPDKGSRSVWKDLLGHQAYEELAKRYKDPFLSCPLNAVLRYELEKHGYTVVVHDCKSDFSRNILESWEEVKRGRTFL